MKLELPCPIEYIVEPAGDSFDVLAGPLDGNDYDGFHAALLRILREDPFESRELFVFTIDMADGSAFVNEIEENYMVAAEDEAWLGLPPLEIEVVDDDILPY